MLRLALYSLFILHIATGQICNTRPCENGICSEEAEGEKAYKCLCQKGWAGIHCNLPQPEVICGEKAIEIFIDERIVTEQGLSPDVEFVQFFDAPSCSASKRAGSYVLKVNAPFKTCGVMIEHKGNDYVFNQQVVWSNTSETVERPLILLDFKCTYKDKYAVSFGGITPLKTSVDFKTSYGVFKVGMALYRSQDFADNNRYGSRPVLSPKDDVCVSTDLKNVAPRDLVLTNRECWASANRNGTGESHRLVSSKCIDDPTAEMLSNGQGDSARFCFQVFKWRDSLQELYMHCVVNVCNATAGEEYCRCEKSRNRRFALSLSETQDRVVVSLGPVYFSDKKQPEGDSNSNDRVYSPPQGNPHTEHGKMHKTIFLIVIGVVIIVLLIALGVIAGVFLNCGGSHSKKAMRSDGEPVMMPDPDTTTSVLE